MTKRVRRLRRMIGEGSLDQEKNISILFDEKCACCKHLCVNDCDLLVQPWECNSEVIKELEERIDEERKERLSEIKKYGIYRKDTVDDF
jgi:hypothetical protein